MLIKTANQQEKVRADGGYVRWVSLIVAARWGHRIDWAQPLGYAYAEIARSNWRVKCPFCPGAQVIEPGEAFFCVDCANQANFFRPMRVIWPAERHTIERLLLKRPNPLNRNWLPRETVEMLIRENMEHGIHDLERTDQPQHR